MLDPYNACTVVISFYSVNTLKNSYGNESSSLNVLLLGLSTYYLFAPLMYVFGLLIDFNLCCLRE